MFLSCASHCQASMTRAPQRSAAQDPGHRISPQMQFYCSLLDSRADLTLMNILDYPWKWQLAAIATFSLLCRCSRPYGHQQRRLIVDAPALTLVKCGVSETRAQVIKPATSEAAPLDGRAYVCLVKIRCGHKRFVCLHILISLTPQLATSMFTVRSQAHLTRFRLRQVHCSLAVSRHIQASA